MSRRKHPQRPSPDVLRHLGKLLDEALEQTFLASDPMAINVEFTPPQLDVSEEPPHRRLLHQSAVLGGSACIQALALEIPLMCSADALPHLCPRWSQT
jgi:hypothetical protein